MRFRTTPHDPAAIFWLLASVYLFDEIPAHWLPPCHVINKFGGISLVEPLTMYEWPMDEYFIVQLQQL